MSIKAAAVVLAGGMGTRMNAALPKQFMKLADKPVLQWSLECFDRTSDIGRIVLVLPEEWLEEGIDIKAIDRFRIGYYDYGKQITIPYFYMNLFLNQEHKFCSPLPLKQMAMTFLLYRR